MQESKGRVSVAFTAPQPRVLEPQESMPQPQPMVPTPSIPRAPPAIEEERTLPAGYIFSSYEIPLSPATVFAVMQ